MSFTHVNVGSKRNLFVLVFAACGLLAHISMGAFTCSHYLTEPNFTPGDDITLNIDYDFGNDTVTGLGAEVFVPPGWGQGAGALTWIAPANAAPGLPGLTYTNNQETHAGFVYNRIDFSFGTTAFGTFGALPKPSGTLTFSIRVPEDTDVNDDFFIRVRLLATIGGFAQPQESTSNPLQVLPPPPPTFSNANPPNGSMATNPPVNQVTAGDEITFTVTMMPAAGTAFTMTGFALETGVWDVAIDEWEFAQPIYTDDGTDDLIDFASAGTSVVGGQQVRTLNGQTFRWTQVGPGTTGVRTFTWVVPSDFTNKAEGPKFVIASIGGSQNNLGEGGFDWAVQVNPVNQPPQIDGTTPNAAVALGAVDEGAAFDFKVAASDPDQPVDTLSYVWFFDNGSSGTWEEVLGQTTDTWAGNIPFETVAHPAKFYDNARVRVVVSDDDPANPLSAEATWTISRINDTNRAPNPPTVAVTVQPAGRIAVPEAFTTQHLLATVTSAGDPDDRPGDMPPYLEPLEYQYVWTATGANSRDAEVARNSGWTTSLTDTLPAAATHKDKIYTCTVTVRDDPYGDGSDQLAAVSAPSNGVAVINSAPVAHNQSVFIRKFAGGDGTAEITLVAFDADQDVLTFGLATDAHGGATQGTVSNFDPATGTLTYTVTDLGTEFYTGNPAGIGPDTLQFAANDGTVDSNMATVTITYRENIPPAPVAGTVEPSDDGITPADQTIDEGATVSFAATFNYGGDPPDSGDYMETVTWYVDGEEVAQQNAVGTPQNLAGAYAFVTDFDTISSADGSHPDTRDFVITAVGRDHNAADSEVLTWTITVQNVNRPPAITGADLVVQGGGDAFVTSVLEAVPQGWADADNDPAGYRYEWYVNDVLQAGQVGNTLAGQFAKHDTVHVVVTPDDGRAENNLGDPKTSNTVAINNTVPTVADQAVSATDGAETDIDLTIGSADADNDTLHYEWVTTPVQGGLVLYASGNATYYAFWPELALGETGQDTFTFHANDGEADSNVATVTITVTGINDAPTAQAIAGLYCEAYDAGDPATSVDIDGFTGDDIDSDDDPTTLVYRVSTFPDPVTEGGLTFKATGLPVADNDDISGKTVVFTPVAGKRGSVEFEYVAVDRHGLASAPAKVSITVGTPLWYPHLAFAGTVGGWHQVQIWDGDVLLLETAVTDGNNDGLYVMSPQAYILAGSDGLLPGNYAWRHRSWDPVADTYGDWSAETALLVDDYGVADVPTGMNAIAGAADGEFTLGLIAPNAQGFQIEIWGPNGYYQLLPEERFMPDADGVVPLNQPTETELVFTTAGDYDWQARGFNPLDTATALDDPAYTPAWSALQTFTVAAGGTAPALAGPTGLYPPASSLLTASTGTTCIAFTWQPVTGATGYVVYISSVSGAPIYNYVDVGNVTRLSTVCLATGSYIWFVVPYDGAGEFGEYSALTYFDVVQTLSVPIITGAVRTDAPDGLTITWNGPAPSHVTIMLFNAADAGWQTMNEVVDPNTGWVSLGTTWGAGNNFVLIQPHTATASGEFSRLFILP